MQRVVFDFKTLRSKNSASATADCHQNFPEGSLQETQAQTLAVETPSSSLKTKEAESPGGSLPNPFAFLTNMKR